MIKYAHVFPRKSLWGIFLVLSVLALAACQSTPSKPSLTAKPGEWIDNETYRVYAVARVAPQKDAKATQEKSQEAAMAQAKKKVLKDFAAKRIDALNLKQEPSQVQDTIQSRLSSTIQSGTVKKIKWNKDKTVCRLSYEVQRNNLKKLVLLGRE